MLAFYFPTYFPTYALLVSISVNNSHDTDLGGMCVDANWRPFRPGKTYPILSALRIHTQRKHARSGPAGRRTRPARVILNASDWLTNHNA